MNPAGPLKKTKRMSRPKYPRRNRPNWLGNLEKILGLVVLGAVVYLVYTYIIKLVLDPVLILYLFLAFSLWFKK